MFTHKPLFALIALIFVGCKSNTQTRASSQVTYPAQSWNTQGFEYPEDLSGIASADGSHCLIVTDESRFVQAGQIHTEQYNISATTKHVLLPDTGHGKAYEIDAEGVAYDATRQSYYITGSHGLGKKKGDDQPDRNLIFQLPYDGDSQQIRQKQIRQASLIPWLRSFAELTPYLNKPLQHNGLNIEGLASSKGVLFIGLRAPNIRGNALIMEMDPSTLFDQGEQKPVLHQAAVGLGRGIREIAALTQGFLLLTGNASAEASKKFPQSEALGPDDHFEILYWHPNEKNRTHLLAALPSNGGKAEGLMVMKETPSHIEIMVLYDSKIGGSPTIIHLPQTKQD